MTICTAASCKCEAVGYSNLCDRHKRVKRRHGHPDQKGITVADLKTYQKRVKARMVKNKDSNAWGILRERWSRVTSLAQGSQVPSSIFKHQRKALEEISKLGTSIYPEAVIEVVLAMYLMQEEEPRRFKSDRAFDFQLVRRVRGLADINAGQYWDQKQQRTKRVYRDLPPTVTVTIAEYLKTAFGVAGLYVARLEQQEADRELLQKVELQKALGDLK